ncbi:MAG: DUF2029 domain-containing protein, partial [Planctomycetes bacterium]|nr:DUF2029 domain-containing protein [Planctomycetota bacterium]
MRQSAGAEVADPPNGPRWRSLIWLSFVILAAIEFAISVRWLARQPMTDLPIFLNATRRFADGGQLYESAGDTEHYAPVAAVFKYPPLYALLLRPFVELRMAVALRALFWVHVVIYVATIAGWLALAGAARRGAPLAAVAGGTIAALSFGPAFESLRGAQLELPILALLALATAAWSTRRDIVLGAALGTAAALKVYPILLLLALLAARRWRAVASFVVTIALLALVCLVAFGTAECRAWLFGVLPLMLREPPTNLLENTSLSRQLMSLGIAPEAAKRIGQAVALPLIAAGCWLAAVAARSGPRAEKLV